MPNILIIDDEVEICKSIQMILEYKDYSVSYSTDSSSGISKLKTNAFDAALLDIKMPGLNGFEILKELQSNNIKTNIIMISAFSSLENAITATKLGAFDFLEKPIDRDKLLISVRNAVKQTKLQIENSDLKSVIFSDNIIIGESRQIKDILSVIDRVAKSDAGILITGENGTGKGLVAHQIHNESNRCENNFVEVNCAAIPNELIESELFGHIKGAFTGALNNRSGKFQQADKGTLFLDEIGDMSLNAQAKVLKAIETGKIERVGSEKEIIVDTRIIAATNKDIQQEIKNGNFREDLFHRLKIIPINIPPLRERKNDIPLLIEHFNKIISEKMNVPPKLFNSDAIDLLKKCAWSGNIRELRNFIERVIIMLPHNEITAADLKAFVPIESLSGTGFLDVSNSFQEFKEKAEKAFIKKQLIANNWNISKTAEILEIQRSHLYNKIKKYSIIKD